jgi:hypothetical protein
MLPIVTWKWHSVNGPRYGPAYVNRLRAMLARHLHLPHELVCVTDDATGLDARIRIVPMPRDWMHTPRCRRRMWQFDRARVAEFGPRFLHLDLDTVLTDDITAIVDRPEPLVCWRAHYAGVVSPAFMLLETGYLHELYVRFAADPDGYPVSTGVRQASDLAMLNHFLKDRPAPATWDERDGFVPYFGAGYQRFEHLGLGPSHQTLPAGTRVVLLGGADLAVLEEGRYPWVREHYLAHSGAAESLAC